MDDLARFRMQY